MLKPFLELYNLDITGNTEKRKNLQYKPDGSAGPEFFEYLPWHKCLYLLYANGAENVSFEPIYTKDGYSVHYMPAVAEGAKKWGVNVNCPEVRVRVTIDGKSREMNYPLINGSSVIKMEEISQQKVATAQMRAYVKLVAQMTGLGLKLWEKEETGGPIEMDREAHNLPVCVNRIKEKYAEAVKRAGSQKELRERLTIDGKKPTESTIKALFSNLSIASEFEHQLERIR